MENGPFSATQEQRPQDGESATRTVHRLWEQPCEPQLELAPIRTRCLTASSVRWEVAEELTVDNMSARSCSPGSGAQFSARSPSAEDVLFRSGNLSGANDSIQSHATETRSHLNSRVMTVEVDAVPRCVALQRLRERRLSAHHNTSKESAQGISRGAALTALRRRREHYAESKAEACELPSTSTAVGERAGLNAAVAQKRMVRPASALQPSPDGLGRTHGPVGTPDSDYRRRKLHHRHMRDSDEDSEGLAGTPLAPPQPSLSSQPSLGSPHPHTATSLEHMLADLDPRFAVKKAPGDACPSTPSSIRTAWTGTPLSQLHINPFCERSTELQPSQPAPNAVDDAAAAGPVGEGLQCAPMHHSLGQSVSVTEVASGKGCCAANPARVSSDLWALESPRHMHGTSSGCCVDSGSPSCTPRAVALTRQLFRSTGAGTEKAPVLTAASDAVAEGCTWSGSRDGVAESWTEAHDPALVWRNKPFTCAACVNNGSGVPYLACLPIALSKHQHGCCAKQSRDSDSLSSESSPRIRSADDEQTQLLLCRDGTVSEQQSACAERCVSPWGSCWHSDGGGYPLSTLVPQFPPLLRALEQSGSFSAWSESPVRDLFPDPPWLEVAAGSPAYNMQFGAAGRDPRVPPHRHSAPAGPMTEGSVGWAAGLRRGRLYGSHMHENTSQGDTLHHWQSERARDPADTGRRDVRDAGRPMRRHTAAQPTSPTRSEDLPFNDEIAKGAAQVVQRLSMSDMQQRALAAAAAADAELSRRRYAHGSSRTLWHTQSAHLHQEFAQHSIQELHAQHSSSRSAYQKQQQAADALAQGRSSSGSGSGFGMHATTPSPSPMHASAGQPCMSERRQPHNRSRSRSNAGGSLQSHDRAAPAPACPSGSRSATSYAHPAEMNSAARTPSKHSRSTSVHRGGSSRGPPAQATPQHARKHAFGQSRRGPRSSPGPVAHMHVDPRPSAQLSPPLAGTGAVTSACSSTMRVSGPHSYAAAQIAAGNSGGGAFGVSAVSGLSGTLSDMQDAGSGISAVGASGVRHGPSTVGGMPYSSRYRLPAAHCALPQHVDRSDTMYAGDGSSVDIQGAHTLVGAESDFSHIMPHSRVEAIRICRQLERKHMQAEYDDLVEVVNSQLLGFDTRKMARSHAPPPPSPAPSGTRSRLSPSTYGTGTPSPARYDTPHTDTSRSSCGMPTSQRANSGSLSSFAALQQWQLSSSTPPGRGHGAPPAFPTLNNGSTFPGPLQGTTAGQSRPTAMAASSTTPTTAGGLKHVLGSGSMSSGRSRAAAPHTPGSSSNPASSSSSAPPHIHQQNSQRSSHAPSPSPPPPTAVASAPHLLRDTPSPLMSPTRWNANPLASNLESSSDAGVAYFHTHITTFPHQQHQPIQSMPSAGQGLHSSSSIEPVAPSKGSGTAGSSRRRRPGASSQASNSMKSAAAAAAAAVAHVTVPEPSAWPPVDTRQVQPPAELGAAPHENSTVQKPTMGVQRLITGQGTALQKALLYMRAREYPRADSAASAPLARQNGASSAELDRRQNDASGPRTCGSGRGPKGPKSSPSPPSSSKTWKLRNGKWVAEEGPGPEVQGSEGDADMQDELVLVRSEHSGTSEALLGISRPDHAQKRWPSAARQPGSGLDGKHSTASGRNGGAYSWYKSRSGAGQSSSGSGSSGRDVNGSRKGTQHQSGTSQSRSTPSEMSGDGYSKGSASLRGNASGVQRPRRTSSPYRKESLPGKLSSLFRALTFRNRPARKRGSYHKAGHASESVWRPDSHESSTLRPAASTRSSDFDTTDRVGSKSIQRHQGSSGAQLASPHDDACSSDLLDYSTQFSSLAPAHSSSLEDPSGGILTNACCFGPGMQRPHVAQRGDTQKLLQTSRSSAHVLVPGTRHRGEHHQHHKSAAPAMCSSLRPVEEGRWPPQGAR